MIGEVGFSDLVASVYEAGADFRHWPETLGLLARKYRAPTLAFAATSLRKDEVWSIAPGLDPIYPERYRAHYHRFDLVAQRAAAFPVGAVLTDEMIVPKREFARTEFFNDFLLPQGSGSILGAVVHAEHGRRFAISVQRSRPFEADEIVLYRRLSPHIQCAVQLNLRLQRLQMRCTASAEALDQLDRGALLVDAAGLVLFANRVAERAFEIDGGLRLVDGRLEARSTVDTPKLHALVSSCCAMDSDVGSGSLMALSCGADRPPITVEVLPLRSREPPFLLASRPVAIIFVTDSDRRPAPDATDRWRQRFNLTAKERAFALEILRGDGLQACADRLGISRATARTHLAHIFEKTGARRQAELVRLLMES